MSFKKSRFTLIKGFGDAFIASEWVPKGAQPYDYNDSDIYPGSVQIDVNATCMSDVTDTINAAMKERNWSDYNGHKPRTFYLFIPLVLAHEMSKLYKRVWNQTNLLIFIDVADSRYVHLYKNDSDRVVQAAVAVALNLRYLHVGIQVDRTERRYLTPMPMYWTVWSDGRQRIETVTPDQDLNFKKSTITGLRGLWLRWFKCRKEKAVLAVFAWKRLEKLFDPQATNPNFDTARLGRDRMEL